jgi:molecular chaperone GrpE
VLIDPFRIQEGVCMKTAGKKNDVHSHKRKNGHDEHVPEATEADGQASAADEASAPAVDAAPAPDDRLLRLQADFDNYRKRMMREKADIYRRANEDIMEELLPVLDHLELALAAVAGADQHDSLAKGFKLVGEQLLTVLSKFGLTPIETSSGVPFDPNVHEAILHMPAAEVPENGIVSRTRAGYMLGGQLLRAAQVVVSSGAPEAGATSGSPGSDPCTTNA